MEKLESSEGFNKFSTDRIKRFFERWIPWIVAGFTLISLDQATGAIHGLIVEAVMDKDPEEALWLRLFFFGLFAFSIWCLAQVRDAFFQARTRHLSNKTAEKSKHLILFLSNIPKDWEKAGGIPDWLNLKWDLETDLATMHELKQKNRDFKWPWEMPLRAARHHIGAMETITLVCSEKSQPQAHLFSTIFHKYEQFKHIPLRMLVNVRNQSKLVDADYFQPGHGPVGSGGWDFESFDNLSTALWRLMKQLKKDKIKEADIMVDFTGGQKVTSVVAAQMTVNRKSKAQYVQTNSPYDVISYDVVHTFTETWALNI